MRACRIRRSVFARRFGSIINIIETRFFFVPASLPVGRSEKTTCSRHRSHYTSSQQLVSRHYLFTRIYARLYVYARLRTAPLIYFKRGSTSKTIIFITYTTRDLCFVFVTRFLYVVRLVVVYFTLVRVRVCVCVSIVHVYVHEPGVRARTYVCMCVCVFLMVLKRQSTINL